ncbi:MAG: glycosyltransferase family 2 protein [Flavobacteriaceae bacterium]|nr:glycosyltransferase family 2 protein [Flavobacteriaceae bacterium]
MSISVITPHYNDPNGLEQVYKCLLAQTQASWQWVIVDDLSDTSIRKKIQDWHQLIDDDRVKLICNAQKSNASVCRNLGVDSALYNHIVFLDADDTISSNFVANRLIQFKDFAVFKNNAVIDKQGRIEILKAVDGSYLNYFLQAKFIWPITAVLWDKSFFNSIGQFHSQLPRLQDVELAIRALQQSTDYLVLDNTVDFYYNVIPIRERRNFLKPVCEAVYLFISELLNTSSLNKEQISLLSGYYYLCVKYLERSGSLENVSLVQRNLMLFYKKGYIGLLNCIFGLAVLKLFVWNMLSPSLFLRINRRIFKPSVN